MDLLKDKVKPLYFRYFTAAFGSSLVSSIYSMVDMAMVGQYYGPDGTAALAVVSPIWNIIYSLGLLMGIGGSVLFSTLRGESAQNEKRSNEYFTAALIGVTGISILTWLGIIFFDRELLILFGAQGNLLDIARDYLLPVKFAVPSFLFCQLLSAFLRNDGDPGLATKAVMFGGIFNVFGDYFCVFTLNMGACGAGLATVIGSLMSLVIMCSHFWGKKNTLKWVRPTAFGKKLREISVTGFSTFFIDVAMGVLTMLFNRQIMKYLGTDALSVYGIIINISTFVQCCAYSVGQAAQPIISINYGAGEHGRVNDTLRYSLFTSAAFAAFWTLAALLIPNVFVRIFMTPTDSILSVAPSIIRKYGISFILLPFNVFSTYYFQAIMKPAVSFAVSVTRGAVLSGILIYILPTLLGADAIWFAMPITELVVAVFVAIMMIKCVREKGCTV